MNDELSLTFYSDILCVWAYIAQARIGAFAGRRGGQLVLTRAPLTADPGGASPDLPWARESGKLCKLTEG